jgi:hypothetical protein
MCRLIRWRRARASQPAARSRKRPDAHTQGREARRLAVQRADKYTLVINLKTAKALGLRSRCSASQMRRSNKTTYVRFGRPASVPAARAISESTDIAEPANADFARVFCTPPTWLPGVGAEQSREVPNWRSSVRSSRTAAPPARRPRASHRARFRTIQDFPKDPPGSDRL